MKTNTTSTLNFSIREWDSQFFHKKIGDVQWDIETSPQSPSETFDLITTRVGALEHTKVKTLQEHGFIYCEGDAQLIKEVSVSATNASYQTATRAQLPKLLTMLDDMYQISRFKKPWFTAQDRDRFYKEWLTKAVYGTYDDCCLLIIEANEICGFVTLKEHPSDAQIGLIGVSSKHQGRGIGKKLLSIAEHYLGQRNCTTLSVATQISNIHALNLYTRFGFRLTETNLWFYKSNL